MTIRKKAKATVHDFTTERAKRGRLPWSFDVDLAAGRFRLTWTKTARPVDLLALADAAELWSKTLARAARQLRKAARQDHRL